MMEMCTVCYGDPELQPCSNCKGRGAVRVPEKRGMTMTERVKAIKEMSKKNNCSLTEAKKLLEESY